MKVDSKMMTDMRRLGDSKAAQGFFLVLAGAFVLWGIGGSLMHVTSDGALTINGQELAASDIAQTYEQREKMVEQMIGHAPSSDEKAQLHVPERVLAEVVNRTVLRQAAETLGLVPAPSVMRQQIAAIPDFQDQKGHFNLESYQQALARGGISVHKFESELAQDMGVKLLSQAIQLPPVSGEAVAPLAAQENSTLQVETLTLTPAAVAAGMQPPNDAQVQAFYTENPNLYRTPEKRSFTVLTLSAAELAKSISVPDSEVAAEYAKNRNSYLVPETRQVAHILFSDEASAKAAREALKKQGDSAAAFAALAKQDSQDPGSKANGGELGDIRQADVVPEFGNEAFSLPENSVGGPVKSSFGWHLIRVSKITKAKLPSEEEMAPKISAGLKLAEATKALGDLQKKVADGLAGGKTLVQVAKENGLSTMTESLLSAAANELPAEIMQTAFATPQGSVSAPVDLGDAASEPGAALAEQLSGKHGADAGKPQGSVAYVQVTQVVAPGVPPLATIHAQAVKDTAKAQVKQQMMQQAQQLLTMLRAPQGPTSLAQAATAMPHQGAAPTVGNLSLKASEQLPEWLQPYALGIMQLPTGAALSTPMQSGDNVVVARLVSRTPGTPDGATLTSTAGSYHEQLQQDLEQLLIAQLTGKAKIDYNTSVLQQVFGPDWQAPQKGLPGMAQ